MSENHCKKCNKPLVEHEKKLCGNCRLKRNQIFINGIKGVAGLAASVLLMVIKRKK